MPLSRILRALRWRQRQWSRDSDRAFHDALFQTAIEDPFSFAYPGYITIRRFADLAGEHLAGATRVRDVGCGPGEITCELAARFPACRFEGVDHSVVAIDRARAHAARRGLSNVSFTVADADGATAMGPCDVVMMFDSFHHLLDPAGFVARAGATAARFVLVEPGGTPLGSWRRAIDADWIASDLDIVRARIEHLLGTPPASADSRPAAREPEGEAVEHRYTLEDFQRFFPGFGLYVRGTTAGLDAYPPGPRVRTPVAEQLGRYAYELVARVDDELRACDRDLLAKHWIIHAVRGAPGDGRRVPSSPAPRGWDGARVRGGFDAAYLRYDGPQELTAGSTARGAVRLHNRSWRAWSSDAAAPVYLSYHWWSTAHEEIDRDGLRSRLPRPLAPDEIADAAFACRAPDVPGRYVLAIDLVEEGVAWFSDAGVPSLTVPVTVR